MPLLTGLWIIIGVLLAIGIAVAVIFAVIFYGLRHLPQPPVRPTQCPACGHTEHEYKAGGLRGDERHSGEAADGTFGYGICKRCGSRWGQYDDSPAYVPSDEEWRRYVQSRENATRGNGDNAQ